jgi:arsenite-transporting ATPase
MTSRAAPRSRVLLFTGKGGVGKTSVAAATALRCADSGLRTVVLSTDPAHSLADAFGLRLRDQPAVIAPGLWAQQLDPTARLSEAWDGVRRYLVDLLDWAGVATIHAEELAVVPGLEEVFSLSDIRARADSGEWDVVVVDCGPTAETIRLLSLPDVLAWYMDRIFPASRRITNAVRPVVGRMTAMPVAGDDVFGALARMYDQLAGVEDLLTDPSRTSVRLVVNPERVVIAEARRTATYLALFGYRVDCVIANRLLPDSVTDPWFKAWKETQAEHLTSIEDGFAPLPVLRADLASDELVGLDTLRSFGEALYRGADPTAIFHDGKPFTITQRGARPTVVIELPFAQASDVDLARHDGELIVTVDTHRRAVVLPDSLRGLAVAGARLTGGKLEVTFDSQGTST